MWMEIIGISTPLIVIPQIIRILRRKSAEDISKWFYVLLLFFQANWFRYGIIIKDVPLILSGGISCISCLIVLFFCFKYTLYKKRTYF